MLGSTCGDGSVLLMIYMRVWCCVVVVFWFWRRSLETLEPDGAIAWSDERSGLRQPAATMADHGRVQQLPAGGSHDVDQQTHGQR